MKDRITQIILLGILITLVVMAFKPEQQINYPVTSQPQPQISLNAGEYLQIAPGLIGIQDDGTHSGYRGQLLLFQYQENEKEFKYIGTLNYEEYINNPEKYGIPIRK
ncbi:hypothetical protein [Cohnella yongneupensis]|uniref:DUF4176 domain-containing protein n=1 Tax=Cohnella yongneupensis TaxID=425006 RepID=A0ABW0R336_9BACL